MATFKKEVNLGSQSIDVDLGSQEVTIDLTFNEIRDCTTREEKMRMAAELYNDDARSFMQELIVEASTNQFEPMLIEDSEESTISFP